MADLYSLLIRAVDSQPENTPEARYAVYHHVRGLYERQLRTGEPPLSEEEILREQAALETIIARVEAEKGTPPPLLMDDFAPVRDLPPEGEIAPRRSSPTQGKQRPASQPERERPRVALRRKDGQSVGLRRSLVVAVIAVVLCVIGGVAWWLRDRAPTTAAVQHDAAPTEQVATDSGKMTDRIPGGNSDAVEQPGAAANVAAGQTAPASQQDAAVAPNNAAQRAFLFELDRNNPQQPRITAGQVLWRFDQASNALRADITLAEAGMAFSLVMKPNSDPSLPASHTVEIVFVSSADATNRTVRDIAVPQMRVDKEPRGVPLAGLPIPVADNVFLIGLSSLPPDVKNNVDLLSKRDWLDLPIRFASGESGTITFAKGVPGSQAITEALAAWK